MWACDNDRRHGIFRFYSPLNKQGDLSWSSYINREKFKVTMSTRICSNHFKQGYRNSQCRSPTLYMNGYDCEDKSQRPAAKIRTTEVWTKTKTKRKQSTDDQLNDGIPNKKVTFDVDLLRENMDLNIPHDDPDVSKIQLMKTQMFLKYR